MNRLYRKCAGIVVFNNEGLVFLGNRIRFKNAWQFPQGGIENNESIEEASRRELYEETGIKTVTLVAVEDTPIRYTFNKVVQSNFRKKGIETNGQDVYFSLFYFNGNEEEINLKTTTPEFNKYKWDSLDFAVKNVVSFKRKTYRSIAKKFKPIIQQYLETIS